MERKEFGIIFAVLCEYFGGTPSEGLTTVYYELLKDLTIDEFKMACRRAMETRVYNGLPKVGELKELLYGKPEEIAALAYQKLVETMKKVGHWETVVFMDGAIGRAVEAMGGWEAVNAITIDEWRFRRKEFETLYIANIRRGNIEPAKLFGAFDRINGFNGQQGSNKPVFIESETKPMISRMAKSNVYQISEKSTEEGLREVALPSEKKQARS